VAVPFLKELTSTGLVSRKAALLIAARPQLLSVETGSLRFEPSVNLRLRLQVNDCEGSMAGEATFHRETPTKMRSALPLEPAQVF
jgi:hypothetical protein